MDLYTVLYRLVLYIFNYQLARGELSAGDIAQFDDEQNWTFTEIGTQILLYLVQIAPELRIIQHFLMVKQEPNNGRIYCKWLIVL
jgi:hypothetical protein